jgi:hypothetical protein
VALNWNPSPSAVSYNVRRATVSGGPHTLLSSPTSTSLVDAVANWGTWYYVVSAVNPLGESANSSEVAATPRPPPALNAVLSASQLELSWPAWATGYNAYSASNLVAPVQWLRVTNAAQNIGGVFNLTLPAAGQQQFFELKGP